MKKDLNVTDDATQSQAPALGRRDLMKMGAGALMLPMLTIPAASAQETPSRPSGVTVLTGAGGRNDANRPYGNGPIDQTTRQIVSYVNSFSESNLTPSVIDALSYVMLDGISALIAGFESVPARISAKMARSVRSDDLKSTVLGYGLTTTPEMASFANTSMLRHCDFNDIGPGGHNSNVIPGILAVGEAVRATGTQVLVAVALAYELMGALTAASGPGASSFGDNLYEGCATVMAVGKLMGLNEDQLANALSLDLVPHMPLNVSTVGYLSMWKGCHSPEAIRCAVFAAWLAHEGMTGPCQPFECRNGLFDHIGKFKQLSMPAPSPDGRLVVERMTFKRFPAQVSLQPVFEMTPQLKALCKVNDIVSISAEAPGNALGATADPTKWDPRNRETADHSMPYAIARSLIDGDLYLDSYTQEKLMDPVVRQLMDKITIQGNSDPQNMGRYRLTVRTKTGGDIVKESHGATPMTHDEIIAKFNRVCAFKSVSDKQRDQARQAWMHLQSIHDIVEPMRNLASFGKPLAL